MVCVCVCVERLIENQTVPVDVELRGLLRAQIIREIVQGEKVYKDS